MILYYTLDFNLLAATNIQAKLAKIDLIIDSLLNVALTAVAMGDTLEYMMDTGQTKISKTYTTPKQVTDAIMDYEKIRSYYVNKLTPRNIRLVDSKNFY